MTTPLYTRDILRLAASIPFLEPIDAPDGEAERRSPTCGSRMAVAVRIEDGRVAALSQRVEACAFGQASAALLARHAPGRGLAEIRAARAGIADWFAGGDDRPDWPGFDLLAAARDYPARHGAILLPFDAAIAALEGQEAAA